MKAFCNDCVQAFRETVVFLHSVSASFSLLPLFEREREGDVLFDVIYLIGVSVATGSSLLCLSASCFQECCWQNKIYFYIYIYIFLERNAVIKIQ